MDKKDKKAHYLALILLEALEDENMKACKELLITYEANPNIVLVERGIAPIHYASGMENVEFAEEIMRLMLELGGDPNVRSDEKLTPLHVAAIWGRTNIVKMLLEKGGDINAVDDENKTSILYAIHECHFDVIKAIQNHIFEKKMEHKKKNLLLRKCNGIINNSSKLLHENNNNLLAIKNLEDKKYTPNRINYNFDATSPYYINITHRKKSQNNKQINDITYIDETLSEIKNHTINNKLIPYESHIPENLFQLTEENLTEYAKLMSPERSKISFIKQWREKVQKAKSRKSILNQFRDIDSLLSGIINDNTIDFTNTELNIDGKKLNDNNDDCVEKSPQKSINFTQFGKLLEQIKNTEIKTDNDDSFITAPDKLSPQKQQQQQLKIPSNQSYFIHSPNKNDYVMQTAEDYVHTDEENGLVFYEKRLITNDALRIRVVSGNNLNKSHTTVSTDFTIPLDYDSEDLRRELTNFGDPPVGPITKSTKKLYMKRLIKYKRNPEKMASLRQQQMAEANNNRLNFSIELEKTVRNIEWFKRIPDYMGLEAEINENFKSKKNIKCDWREGNIKTSFIYLLIDPRISNNLPGQSMYMEQHDIWKKFLSSIFYVGKGKSIRPYQHLYDAMKIFSRFYERQTKETIEKVTIYGGQKIPKTVPLDKLFGKALTDVTDSKKIERILDIWKSEKGVICLHVFHNILPAEAYTREASIIDALGLEHLTNLKRGDYYGITKTWSMRQRKFLGIALLYKALQIFLVEGESQLLPSDLI